MVRNKIQASAPVDTVFAGMLKTLVQETGLTQQAFLDELLAQTEKEVTLACFNGWLNARYSPSSEKEKERILLAARAVHREALRYPKPPQDVDAETVRQQIAVWTKNLTLKQISVITGLPFITLRSWEIGRHKRIRYAKWQQALKLMEMWTDNANDLKTEMREAQEILYHRPKPKRQVQVEPETGRPRIDGVLSLRRPSATPGSAERPTGSGQ